MRIITKDELINTYKDEVHLLEVTQFQASNVVTLNIESVSEFIKLTKELNVNQVYFDYLYYSVNNYVIPLDTYDEFSVGINIEIKKHNNLIESFDFSRPKQLRLFTMLNSTIIGISLCDFWISEMKILDSDSKCSEIEEKFFKEFKSKQKEEIENEQEDKEELKDYILNDHEFSYKKNQRLRQEYLCDLLSKDEFEKYSYLFEGNFDRGISIPMKHYMDRVWQEYREAKKNNSIN